MVGWAEVDDKNVEEMARDAMSKPAIAAAPIMSVSRSLSLALWVALASQTGLVLGRPLSRTGLWSF